MSQPDRGGERGRERGSEIKMQVKRKIKAAIGRGEESADLRVLVPGVW